MRIIKIFLFGILLIVFSPHSYSQDNRTIETKVADLLARLPAYDNEVTAKLMGDMSLLGESGIKAICNQIIPAGTGDDTKPRFAVECYSRFLSGNGKEADIMAWEKNCIEYVNNRKDFGVKDFFMKQLQQIGGDASIEAVKSYIINKEACEPSVAVILAAGGEKAEKALAEALKNKDITCAASVMNALASMKSKIAVSEYIEWASGTDFNIKKAAYNALAMSGSPLAYPVLSDVAKNVLYIWEVTGATSSLLNYADMAGKEGDIKTMDKICKLVISKIKEDGAIQNKSAALAIYTRYHMEDAMPLILKAASHPDNQYRTAAMRFSLNIPGPEAVSAWIRYFKKAIPAAKPEIIAMLGVRGDGLALPLINSALSDENMDVRKEAAEAIVKISGKESMNSLINYLISFKTPEDQVIAKQALMTVTNNENAGLLLPVLKEGTPEAKKTVLELLAWNKDNKYFSDVFPFTSSEDEMVKTAAIKSLSGLSGPGNLDELTGLLFKAEKAEHITDLQNAIAVAANKIPDQEKRSEMLVKLLEKGGSSSSKIIPVLSKTGGREALDAVLKAFNSGSTEIRDISFKSLTGWRDYNASSALYEIIASGNKTYEDQAFNGYIRLIRTAELPDEQKLLLLRKLMPFASSSEKKNAIINELGRLKTYPTLFFVSDYLDDPATSSDAARAIMNIALPSPNSTNGMYGDIVKKILVKIAVQLSGAESDYNREMVNKYLANMPEEEGFKSMFNGKDLSGWHGLVEDPVKRSKMKSSELAKKQLEADRKVPNNWSVRDGCIWFNGKGDNLCSIKEYGDFEMLVDLSEILETRQLQPAQTKHYRVLCKVYDQE